MYVRSELSSVDKFLLKMLYMCMNNHMHRALLCDKRDRKRKILINKINTFLKNNNNLTKTFESGKCIALKNSAQQLRKICKQSVVC